MILNLRAQIINEFLKYILVKFILLFISKCMLLVAMLFYKHFAIEFVLMASYTTQIRISFLA